MSKCINKSDIKPRIRSLLHDCGVSESFSVVFALLDDQIGVMLSSKLFISGH